MQVLQDAASAPHASAVPMHAPLALQRPPESQAVMPSSQGPFALMGCAWQVPLAQVPAVQSLFRLVQSRGVLTHKPPEHASVVQALPSVHVPALLSLCWHPAAAEQKSVVQGLLSSQKTGPLTGVYTHPVEVLQVSSVHWSLSLQMVGTSTTQAPLEHTLTVQGLPSSHAAPSAWRPYVHVVPLVHVVPSTCWQMPGVSHPTAQQMPPTQ